MIDDALIVEHLPLVELIVRKTIKKFKHKSDWEDYIQVGRMGLLQAASRFDPQNAQKASFRTFAAHRIQGSVLDERRRRDTTSRFGRKHGLIRRYISLSDFDEYVYQNDEDRPPPRVPVQLSVRPTEHDHIAERWLGRALAQVDGRHRLVLMLRYLFGYRQQDVAEMMELSESRIKQLEDEGMRALRAAYTGLRDSI